ncbi:MFS transporter [Nonomuraea thailandensis]
MSTRQEAAGQAAGLDDARAAGGHGGHGGHGRSPARLPLVVHVLAVGTFLMITTEFVVAGLLPEIAADLRVSVPQAGLLITVFAAGHLVVAVGSGFGLLLAARFVTALATGAFWAVANVAAGRAAGPAASARALGLVGAGGMLANVVGVPIGAFAGQLAGWRGAGRLRDHDRRGAVGLLLHSAAADRPGRCRGRARAAGSRRLRPRVPGRLAGGGRLGDARPHTTTIAAAAGAAVLLAAICLLPAHAGATVVLVVLLGFFGLGANPVLISLSVRFAGDAPTLASALSVSAFNAGTAAGSWLAGRALDSALGATGPAAVGAAIAALTLIPTITIAVIHHSPRTTR